MIGVTFASVGDLHVFRLSRVSTGSVENNVIHFNELPYPGTEARMLDFSSTISEDIYNFVESEKIWRVCFVLIGLAEADSTRSDLCVYIGILSLIRIVCLHRHIIAHPNRVFTSVYYRPSESCVYIYYRPATYLTMRCSTSVYWQRYIREVLLRTIFSTTSNNCVFLVFNFFSSSSSS